MELSALKSMLRGGKIASVTFLKRCDGKERRMICRTGVHKGLTGSGGNYNPDDHNLVTVFDMEKRGYRTIPAEGVIEVRARKKVARFQP